LSYFDGRHHFTDENGVDMVRFNLTFDSNDDSELDILKEDLNAIGIKMRNVDPVKVDWFPYKEHHLNDMGTDLQSPDDGLNQDHPGFTDQEYLQRRNLIAENGLGYKMGSPIPGFDYNEQETGLWTHIWDILYPKLMEHGCKEYKENFNKLEDAGYFKRDSIPQLEDLNQFLQRESNWRIKPVNGILSQREFLNCLAFRTFCCTQYIRHHSNPEYTPEPDILHEFMGHVPMFANKQVCDISQLIGVLSLGATDAQVAQLGSIYWFTIEFGTCLEEGQNKFYGAGVASSFGEIDNMVACQDIRELDLVNNPPPVDFIVQDVQPFYY
jgi:phenylalanine-4-hydroxylase